MSETTMPAVEATAVEGGREPVHYELAFHVLPTIAEGEVADVFTAIKTLITKEGGVITGEEAPEHFELAYDIVKYLEGRNRTFSTAYFGWVRFTLSPSQLESLTESVDSTKELLRYLLIRLTKVEEANPFRFQEALADKKVRTIGDEEGEVIPEVDAEVVTTEEEPAAEAVVTLGGEEVK